jgi:hypothetical protein
VAESMLGWGVPSGKLDNVEFIRVDRLAFKTYFTVHKHDDNE